MSEQHKSKHFIKAGEALAAESKTWNLPPVTGDEKPPEYTNAMRKPEGWVYEPPEPEEEPPQPPTLEEIEAIRQAAYDEGFAEGKEAGFNQGLAEGQEKGHAEGLEQGTQTGIEQGLEQGKGLIEEKADAWNQILDAINTPLRHIDEHVEQEIVNLASHLAKAVVKTELKTNKDILIKTVKDAVDALPINNSQFEIHLHPNDIQTITDVYTEEGIEKKGWRLMAEPAMQTGSCEIKTQSSSVTYTIEQRIEEILDRFLQDSQSSH
ncbi:hypothetical protein C2869_13400 [Saccharobesus litoralis]|uniref:Flagellar assembly protein FliH n=1 Tax=Saccharobesus litoralis TaxID=2172099 RepID=A0A2S0VT62_9ALTE|nr:flagellar assembly protein FliH [Saccharobesus litoralis]AWB67372.1 hypothetical protein C2869_13400 [Saccharobesus litoralis]